jgi:hypothetical protein
MRSVVGRSVHQGVRNRFLGRGLRALQRSECAVENASHAGASGSVFYGCGVREYLGHENESSQRRFESRRWTYTMGIQCSLLATDQVRFAEIGRLRPVTRVASAGWC